MYWKCFVRVNLIDDELLSLMSRAGCIQVRFGIESGSNAILKTIKKGFTIEKAYQAVILALKHIPSVHASFIWGYPFESIEQCRETIQWIQKFQHAGCTALNFLLSPLPNSEIFRSYSGPLDFNDKMMANFNCSGGEDYTKEGTRVLENSKYMFEFIQKYPKVFPGFYLYDFKNNIAPKMRMVYKEHSLTFRGMKDIKVDDYDLVDL
jgi:coproporphyrinogen III oxidase-like Fe-S oxidoreductase